jgi:hypothetical protein
MADVAELSKQTLFRSNNVPGSGSTPSVSKDPSSGLRWDKVIAD